MNWSSSLKKSFEGRLHAGNFLVPQCPIFCSLFHIAMLLKRLLREAKKEEKLVTGQFGKGMAFIKFASSQSINCRTRIALIPCGLIDHV